MPDYPADGPIWWQTLTSDEDPAVEFVAQAMAYREQWAKAEKVFFAAPADDESRGPALRAAHDRYFTTATTAYTAAALLKGWKWSAIRESLEMGDAWEHLYAWFWDAMGFTENAEADAVVSRLVAERAPAEVQP